jgi:hypothetical protein
MMERQRIINIIETVSAKYNFAKIQFEHRRHRKHGIDEKK